MLDSGENCLLLWEFEMLSMGGPGQESYIKNLIIVSITVKTLPRWETGEGAVVIISNLAFLSLFLRHRFKTGITPSDQLIINREPKILSIAVVVI